MLLFFFIFSDWRKEQNHTHSKRLHVDASLLTDVCFFKFCPVSLFVLLWIKCLSLLLRSVRRLKQADPQTLLKVFFVQLWLNLHRKYAFYVPPNYLIYKNVTWLNVTESRGLFNAFIVLCHNSQTPVQRVKLGFTALSGFLMVLWVYANFKKNYQPVINVTQINAEI